MQLDVHSFRHADLQRRYSRLPSINNLDDCFLIAVHDFVGTEKAAPSTTTTLSFNEEICLRLALNLNAVHEHDKYLSWLFFLASLNFRNSCSVRFLGPIL